MSLRETFSGAGGYGETVTAMAAIAMLAHRLSSILKDVTPEVVGAARAWRERLESEAEIQKAHDNLVVAVREVRATQADILEALARFDPQVPPDDTTS